MIVIFYVKHVEFEVQSDVSHETQTIEAQLKGMITKRRL
jgi:hypothetical protein